MKALNGTNMSVSSFTGNPGNSIRIQLSRLETSDEGTFGVLSIGDSHYFSGELPNRNNKPNASCIPEGTYTCVWTYSPKLRRKAYLINVPNREGIRIHSANFMGDDTKGFKKQLNGCIALGQKIGTMDGQKAILLSSPAVREFEDCMAGRPFELEIKGVDA